VPSGAAQEGGSPAAQATRGSPGTGGAQKHCAAGTGALPFWRRQQLSAAGGRHSGRCQVWAWPLAGLGAGWRFNPSACLRYQPISNANESREPNRSQRRQTSAHARRQPAMVSAASWPIRPYPVTSSDLVDAPNHRLPVPLDRCVAASRAAAGSGRGRVAVRITLTAETSCGGLLR
jgi:hypothetical protein